MRKIVIMFLLVTALAVCGISSAGAVGEDPSVYSTRELDDSWYFVLVSQINILELSSFLTGSTFPRPIIF